MRAKNFTAGCAALLVSALLFVGSFPLPSLSGLAWIALVPLLVVIRSSTAGWAIGGAGLWGMAAAYGVTDWLPATLERYYGQPYWLGLGLFLTASALMGAADYMAFAAVYRFVATRTRSSTTVLIASAAWVVAELGRARLFTGNPWGLLGYSQLAVSTSAASVHAERAVANGQALGGAARTPVALDTTAYGDWLAQRVVQNADWGGVYVVGFVLVAVNLGLAEAWVRRFTPPVDERRVDSARNTWWTGVLVAAALAIVATTYGEMRLREFRAESNDQALSVLLVQGNVDNGARWNPNDYARNLGHYLDLTRKGLDKPDGREHDANGPTPASPRSAELIVWPENAVTFFVDREPDYRAAIARVTEPAGSTLLLGAPRFEGRHSPLYFNSAFILAPDGKVTASYDKEHLLPFAEYFPFGAIGFLRDAFGRVREFTPGTHSQGLPTPVGEAGIGICNEAMFPRIMRKRVHDTTAFLVNLSNDSWVGAEEFGEHQLSIAKMRAIEHRRDLLRSSTSGPSAIVGATGAVRAKLNSGETGVLHGQVTPRFRRTLYSKHGDLFAWCCLASVLLTLAALLATARRKHSLL